MPRNASPSFLSGLLQSIASRGSALLGLAADAPRGPADLADLCEALLSGRGEASGVALARDTLAGWEALDPAGKAEFLRIFAERFDADHPAVDAAIAAYQAAPGPDTLMALHEAAEPRRQEVIRRLNLAPGGTATLVTMRQTLLEVMGDDPALHALDADFVHLFSSWFNRGFLVLRRIDWATPANILEKIIRYEAVHTITGWDELRRRLAPSDRRLYAFFHPQLNDEPLIFVEIALAADAPADIAGLLREDRTPIPEDSATHAVFYSISNCQDGLRGISFGNFLIKQVVEDLAHELPRLSEFLTLSPVPGFARWLTRERRDADSVLLEPADREILAGLDQPAWWRDPAAVTKLTPAISSALAVFLLEAKDRRGKPQDAVARFHLGNGARLERINPMGDVSARGLEQSFGWMVNYRYKLDAIEANHEAYAERNEVIAAPSVRRLLRQPARWDGLLDALRSRTDDTAPAPTPALPETGPARG